MTSEPTRTVDARDLRFAYGRGRDVLDLAHFHVDAGEKVFLRGPSGSGKSTLLGLIAGVLQPQSGVLTVLGEDLSALSAGRRDKLRAEHLGVVFQLFNLLPYLSVIDNVVLPCRFSRARKARAEASHGSQAKAAKTLLSQLGLTDPALLMRPARDLSVGQQQRVAAARALIGRPRLVIADEPTSALDADTRDAFLSLLIAECSAAGASLIFVSHDAGLAGLFDRSVDLMAINRATQNLPVDAANVGAGA
jgi:putative ABC transport system ATP-binding protein